MSENKTVTIVGAADEEIIISEHYINQLQDTVNWLAQEVAREDNPEKWRQLSTELNEAKAQLYRIQPLFG